MDRVNAGEDQLSTMECRYIRKDGAIIWVRGAVASVKDNTGKPYLIIAMIEEISPQKEAEDLVKAQNEEIQATFDQIAVGIVHVDLQGHYLRVNQRICDMFGYTQEELFQKTFQDLTLPEDRPESTKVLRKLLSGEIKVSSVPKRYIRKDGSIIWTHASASVVRDDAGEPKYLVTAIVDLTEQKYSSGNHPKTI